MTANNYPRKSICVYSHLYPTVVHPANGKFIHDQVQLLHEETSLDIKVLVPTPIALPFTKRKIKNSAPLIHDPIDAERVTYFSLPRKHLPKLIQKSLIKNSRKHIEQQNFDIIHVHWLYPDGLCIPAFKQMGYKCILTIHGSDWHQTKHRKSLRPLIKQALTHSEVILFSGPKLKEDLESTFPQFAAKSRVIYNMVDETIYQPPSQEEKKRQRKHLSWNQNKLHSLTVANIRHEKGIDLLLKAIIYANEFSDIDFHIIGGTRKDKYAKRIETLVKKAQHQNVFIHKPVSPKTLLTYYQAADFYTLPSRREGFNVSLLEALACGLPTICTDVGGNKLIINNQNGLIIDKTNSSDIHKTLLKLKVKLENFNPSKIHSNIVKDFGKQAFLKKLLSVYNSF
ncbi:MAG: glycosyltransferase family 4 protein [Balneolaceae bacterium]|nr:glycosyltransferase family 4 protein [Balneolaceae bacterium]